MGVTETGADARPGADEHDGNAEDPKDSAMLVSAAIATTAEDKAGGANCGTTMVSMLVQQ